MRQSAYNWMEANPAGGVMVVRFTSHAIVDARAIQIITEELMHLVDDLGHRQLLLNFEGVRSISSQMLASLLKLHQRLNTLGGRLELCGISSDLVEIFKLTKLNQLLHIYSDEEDAMGSFYS